MNLDETVDSRWSLGSSPGRSFLAPKSRVFDGLASEAQERETGSIRSGGDLRDGSGGSGVDPGISGISVFFT